VQHGLRQTAIRMLQLVDVAIVKAAAAVQRNSS
jgi:hypothetical protein